MKNKKFKGIVKNAQALLTKRSPEILTGIGIAGMLSTTILAVRATPKALQLIEEEKQEQDLEELTPIETVKVCWKPYIPAAVTGVISVGCLIGATSVSTRRQAALATAYALSLTDFAEYKEKVVETIGEKKEKTVRDKVNKSRIENNPVSQNQVIITGGGETLCFDALSGRYFYSDIEKLKKAENILNKNLLDEMYLSLTYFYNEIGLAPTSISDYIGWDVQKGLIELEFYPQMSDQGKPCIAFEFNIPPVYGFDEFS